MSFLRCSRCGFSHCICGYSSNYERSTKLKSLFYEAVSSQDELLWKRFNSSYHDELKRTDFGVEYDLFLNKETINYTNQKGENILMILFNQHRKLQLISLINRFRKYIINIDMLFWHFCHNNDNYFHNNNNYEIAELMLNIYKDKCFNITMDFSQLFQEKYSFIPNTNIILKIISTHSNDQEIIKKFFFYCNHNGDSIMSKLFDKFNRETIIENYDVIIAHLIKNGDTASIINIIENYNELVVSKPEYILINAIKCSACLLINYIIEHSTDAKMSCFVKYIETINQTELNELLHHAYLKKMDLVILFIIRILGEKIYPNINEIMKKAITLNMKTLVNYIIEKYGNLINLYELLKMQMYAHQHKMENVIIFMIQKYEDYNLIINLALSGSKDSESKIIEYRTRIPSYLKKFIFTYLKNTVDLNISELLTKSINTKMENVVLYIISNYKNVMIKNITYYSNIFRRINISAGFTQIKSIMINPPNVECHIENNIELFSALEIKDEIKILSLIKEDKNIINRNNIDYIFTKTITSNLPLVFSKIIKKYSHLCNPGLINKNGNTPLIMTCTSKQINFILLLLKTYGNRTLPHHANKKGRTAMTIIESCKFYTDSLKDEIKKFIS